MSVRHQMNIVLVRRSCEKKCRDLQQLDFGHCISDSVVKMAASFLAIDRSFKLSVILINISTTEYDGSDHRWCSRYEMECQI